MKKVFSYLMNKYNSILLVVPVIAFPPVMEAVVVSEIIDDSF